jgi:hypothetical protein
MTTKRPYAPGRTHGHATQYVIDYLRTHGEATARRMADASERPKSAANITQILRRHPELFEEIGERPDGRTVWGLVAGR